MFSTPLICSSIGATTVAATTSALAPGYWPVTVMMGGAISGYCATGSRANATAPRITNTIDTTAAKIGRSMKKRDRVIAVVFRWRTGLAARHDEVDSRYQFGQNGWQVREGPRLPLNPLCLSRHGPAVSRPPAAAASPW